MVVSLCYLLEILAVIYSLHYLYNEEIRFDIATIALILVELFGMNILYWFECRQELSLLIYPIIMAYCGVKFGIDIKKIIINNVLNILILSTLQAIIGMLFHFLFSIKTMKENELLIINTVLFIIVFLFLKHIKLFKLARIIQSNELLIITSLIVIAVSVCSLIITCKKNREFELWYYSILIVSIMLILVTMIDIGKHKMRAKEFQAELRLHKLYEKSFQSLIEDICARQHEFDNHINTIYSQHFLHKTYEELVSVQRSYCENIVEANHFNKLLSKGNPIILGFLYGKLSEAEKKGIDVTYKVNIGDLESRVPVHKIVELLGNLLDNAIEVLAREEELNKMKLMMIENQYEIMIDVSNECNHLGYDDVQKFFKKGYSKKGYNRGYGLYNVKKICEEYSIVMETIIDEEFKKQQIRFVLTINKSL